MTDYTNRARMPVSINGKRYENFKDGLKLAGLFEYFTDRQRRAFRKELRDKRRMVRKIDGGKYTFRALA